MKTIRILLLMVISMVLISCASSQDRAYEAQEGVHNKRIELVEKYQDCMDDAGDDKMKAEACDQYRKAAEALK